jgi:hypothetical protein
MALFRERRLVFLQKGVGSVAERAAQEKGTEASREADMKQELEERRERLRTSIFDAFRSQQEKFLTQKDLADLQKGLEKMDLDTQEIDGWEKYLKEGYGKQAEKAQRAFDALIVQAKEKRILGEKGLKQWESDFFAAERNEKERMVKTAFPNWIGRVEKMMNSRKEWLKQERTRALPKSKVAGIESFLNDATFIELKEKEQRSLLAQVQAALQAKEEGKDVVYDEAKGMLDEAVHGGYLHPNKIGRWLLHAMNEPDPAMFIRTTLKQFLINWKAISWEFDDFEAQIGRLPLIERTFDVVEKGAFLQWSHRKCVQYLAEKKRELTLAKTTEETKNKKLRDANVHVRHAMKQRDWVDAEHQVLAGLREFPNDPELLSMQKAIAAKREEIDAEKKADDEVPANQLNAEINTMIDSLPMEVKDMAVICCTYDARSKDSNTPTMRMLRGVLYNAEWVRMQGYYDDTQRDADIHSKEVIEETKQHIDEGHENAIEYNRVSGGTAHVRAINGKPSAPEYIYATADTLSQQHVAQGLIDNKDSADLKYWGILETQLGRAQVQQLAYNTLPTLGRKLGNLLGRGEEFKRTSSTQLPETKKPEGEAGSNEQ